ncbi:MAG: lactate utilization protein [Thermicanus sp.]|nr:lactate utilization protein [Thermicanus sp.]
MRISHSFILPPTRFYDGMDREEMINGFLESLKALQVRYDRLTAEELPARLEKRVEEKKIRSLIYWDDPRLEALGIPQALEGSASQGKIDRSIRWGEGSEEELRREAADVELGITMADLGIAETGSLMLLNGNGRGRLVSLTPPVYFAILHEQNVVPRLTQAFSYIQDLIPSGLPSCINWITGPSRTADIEGDLSIGVHGPGEVEVFLIRS